MAVVAEGSSAAADSRSPEILSDEQIEELLQEAEARLRAKAGLPTKVIDNDELALESTTSVPAKRVRLPKLEHGVDRSSYLKDQNGIVRTNSILMVPAEQRRRADGLREVLRENGTRKVVSSSLLLTQPFSHEEIISQFSLDADQHLILRVSCFHEIFIIIIVTLTCFIHIIIAHASKTIVVADV